MTPYVDCAFALRHLDAFVDAELSLADQVLLESHFRWCTACAAHVDDLRVVGAALRAGSRQRDVTLDRALTDMGMAVLDRVETERRQSVGARVGAIAESCLDLRFVWPAMGASLALLVSVGLATTVWRSASEQQPASLAAMIESLADPGSNQNPMRLDGAIVVPRVLSGRGVSATAAFSEQYGEDQVVAVATVVTREGLIGTYELLEVGATVPRRGSDRRSEADVADLLNAVRQTRFAPAQAPGGRAVAVNMLWLFATTTVRASEMPLDLGVPLAAPVGRAVPRSLRGAPVGDAPSDVAPVEPVDRGPEAADPSATV